VSGEDDDEEEEEEERDAAEQLLRKTLKEGGSVSGVSKKLAPPLLILLPPPSPPTLLLLTHKPMYLPREKHQFCRTFLSVVANICASRAACKTTNCGSSYLLLLFSFCFLFHHHYYSCSHTNPSISSEKITKFCRFLFRGCKHMCIKSSLQNYKCGSSHFLLLLFSFCFFFHHQHHHHYSCSHTNPSITSGEKNQILQIFLCYCKYM
jgi:hypothetical protein